MAGEELELDPNGFVVIDIDQRKERILVRWYGYDRKLKGGIEGDKADELSKLIIEKGWIGSLDHAAYLGRELQKAEIALKAKKKYVQDEPFFL